MTVYRFRSPSLPATPRPRLMQRVATAVAGALTAPVVLAACAHGSQDASPAPKPTLKPDTSASTSHAVPTPPAVTKTTTPPAPPPSTARATPPPPSHPFTRTPEVLYLDYDGPTIHNCSNRCEDAQSNQSFIIGQGFGLDHYTFAPYPVADRPAVTAEVQKLFAPWNVQVVTTRPASGPYEMAVISPSDPPNAPHGISNIDCGNQNPNQIVFVMRTGDPYTQEDLLGNGVSGPKKVGVEVAHETGHSDGLGHLQDPLVMNETSNAETWPRAPYVTDGTAFACTSGDSLDASAYLDKVLGRRG